jgi:peptidoglycan/LPS O-acetylase OafA/YrhL
MLAFCLLWTLIAGFPPDVKSLGKNIVSAIFSVSNLVFYQSSGYFSEKIQLNPLLHTWSLGVEEQFYVFFPLILLALRKVSQTRRLQAIGLIAVASLAWAIWQVHGDPSAAFYLMPSRAWELMIGALLALGVLPQTSHRMLAEALGVGGLGLIGASIYLTTQSTPFPGLAALPPCLGAALLIYSGSAVKTRASQLLACEPLRFIGLISYSLYIWHWPILVFYREAVHAPLALEKLLLVAVSLVVAALSWRFIERPFRKGGRSHSPRRSLALAATTMVLGSTLAVGAQLANASRSDLAQRVNTTLAYIDYDPNAPMRVGTCFLTSGSDNPALFKRDTCLQTEPGKPNVLVIGDSHAADLWSGLVQVHPEVNFLQATASGCKPVLHPQGIARCTSVMNYVFKQFLPHTHLNAIIISARWENHDVAAVKQTAEALRPYADRVVVLGPIVEYDELLPRLLARSLYDNDPHLMARHREGAQRKTDRLLADALTAPGISYVSIYDALCDGSCVVWANPDTPLMFDTDHLTQAGARLLVRRIGLRGVGLAPNEAPANKAPLQG